MAIGNQRHCRSARPARFETFGHRDPAGWQCPRSNSLKMKLTTSAFVIVACATPEPGRGNPLIAAATMPADAMIRIEDPDLPARSIDAQRADYANPVS
jgi:hypothetical protein